MSPAPRAKLWGPAGKVGYALCCVASVAVLVASGFSYFVVKAVAGIGGSHAIASGPSIGAQNILVMGLESRTDWNGNILPGDVLRAMHAGSRQAVENGAGGNATNTLILIHIFAGGTKAVGFSIPRDDWVNFADTVGPEHSGKIDQAYGVSMYYEQAKLRQQDPNISKDQLAFQGNEAGRKAAVATVEKLTGVRVDHFAEVNMDGFYELAKVFGGVEVCLLHATKDHNSGANFRRGYQHLDASQALSFVRQRDNLPNGDLDRTHRQQAFIASVMQELHKEGVFSDLSKINTLLSQANKYVITDSGWNLLDFAAQMRGLTSGNLVFHTLPIKGYATIDNQDANLIDPTYIKSIIKAAFYPKPAAPRQHKHPASASPDKSITVDVLNGGYTTGLAGQVQSALVKQGYQAGKLGNTASRTSTAVYYGSGAAGNASKIASTFGTQASQSASVPADHVQVLLGSSSTTLPSGLGGSSPTPHSSSSVAIPTKGPQGGAVHAVNGIPCVN